MNSDENVVKKIVKPYPIQARIQSGSVVFQANIVKLSVLGFLVELNDIFVKVQQKFEAEFTLPALNKIILQQVQVVKTYDQYRPPTARPIDKNGNVIAESTSVAVRIAEFHFKELSSQQREQIKKFLVAIGQVPR